MTFRDLEYMVAVAEHGHFGRAAAHCHASQRALSLRLRKLEGERGVQLIERTSRRVVITATGQVFVERARHILRCRQELLDGAALEPGRMPSEVTLGMIPTIAPYLSGKALAAMKKAHPHTRVRVVEDVTTNLVQAVSRGEMDAAIIATPVEDTLLEETLLQEDEMLLALAASHPLAKKKLPTPHDFAKELLLLLKDGHCLRDQALSFCVAKGGPTAQHSIAASIETLKALIRAGQGVTLIPRMAIDGCPKDELLRYVRLRPAPSRQIRVISRKTARVGQVLAEALRRVGAGKQP